MPPVLDRDTILERFLDALPYEPYAFQEQAILEWFECEDGLLVSAPTGMGKTLVAEAAVFEALHSGRRLYYTTPLIALTDQKMRELADRAESWGFSRESVGLLTGNRRVNPDAPVLVVVAEILLNHLLEEGRDFGDVSAVVMDEFHWFNDPERGAVWELSCVLLPKGCRLMLLSATVGNAVDFCSWLHQRHRRNLRLVRTDERRVPLEYVWVGDKLLTEHLAGMAQGGEDGRRSPALVFCFSRDECWEMAERLKGLPLVEQETRAAIEEQLAAVDLSRGVGVKLAQMLRRGVGVHHAGVLPAHKDLVERLFEARLIPFVVCTETLAAGINLPARSVVLSTLIKGRPGEKKLLPPSAAHQMFGRAGRPQYDDHGWVFALAHEDDVRIQRWKEKYDQIPATTKDPGLLRARKQLERKRPTRRKTEQYWEEAQFRKLVESPPAKLGSRTMIPLRFLVWLLEHDGSVARVRRFLAGRFESSQRLAGFERSLDEMLANLAALGFLSRDEQADAVTLDPSVHGLLDFRSVDPLYGHWLARTLVPASLDEKLAALESVLPLPFQVSKRCEPPFDLPKGPLQEHELEPLMVSLGVPLAAPEKTEADLDRERLFGRDWEAEEEARPPTFPEMLLIAWKADLPHPVDLLVQSQWVAGGVFDAGGDFFRFCASRQLARSEGLVLRHLLRLVLLAGEFRTRSGGDPDYDSIASRATAAAAAVDAGYTERFLQSATEAGELLR